MRKAPGKDVLRKGSASLLQTTSVKVVSFCLYKPGLSVSGTTTSNWISQLINELKRLIGYSIDELKRLIGYSKRL